MAADDILALVVFSIAAIAYTFEVVGDWYVDRDNKQIDEVDFTDFPVVAKHTTQLKWVMKQMKLAGNRATLDRADALIDRFFLKFPNL